MVFRLEDAVRIMHISQLSTKNILYDSILAMFFFSVVPLISHYFNNPGKKLIGLLNYFYIGGYKIELQGKITMNKYGLVTYTFTDNIKSILFYINKNITNFNIHSLQEIITDHKLHLDKIDKKVLESNLIINQINFFNITENIKCKIDISKDEQEYVSGKEGTQTEKMLLSVILRNDKDIKTIIDFLNKIRHEYIEYTSQNILSNQFYFGIDNIDSDANKINYSEYQFISNVKFDNIFFESKKDVLDSINFFIKNKDYYSNHGLPYRLSLLLHGEPGCGKTSLIKAIANYTKRHIVNINFKSIKNKKNLENIFFSNTINNYKINNDNKIFIIEEFDVNANEILNDRNINYLSNTIDTIKNAALFNESKDNTKNKSIQSSLIQELQNNTLTLGDILEIFDGVIENSGRILIITTNDYSKLDKALIRPGRIDKIINFKKCSNDILYQIIDNFYNDIDKNLLNKINNFEEYKYTPAEIINQCCLYKNDPSKLIEILSNNI
tara:strand:- start:3759 stop:5249 length:1491 start_codon:yes stop_codon:yes gene_type:complete